MKKFSSKKIAMIGIFVAMCVIANIFTIELVPKVLVLSVTATVCFLAAAVFNPITAFLIGFLGDVIGCIIHPMGPYNVLISIASGLHACIPATLFFLYNRFGGKNKKSGMFEMVTLCILSYFLTLTICTAGINTYALWSMYAAGKKSFVAYLSARFPMQAVVALINAVISTILLVAMKKIPSISGYINIGARRD